MVDDNLPSVDRRSFIKAGTAGAIAAAGVTNVQAGRDPGPKENELLIGTTDDVVTSSAAASIQEATPSFSNVVHENEKIGYLALELPAVASQQAQDRVVRQLESRDDVRYVEENKTVYPFEVTPNDPRYSEQYAPDQVNAPTAWDLLGDFGSEDVSIAVVDTGADYTHETLESRYDSTKGYDFVDDDSDPAPSGADHGTHVSGIASATTNNGVGTAGISDSQLYSLRALGNRGGSISDIADAVQWAADNGADLVNMSLGGGGSNQTMQEAVSYAYERDVLLIAAAGNDGSRGVSYPAAYDNVMAISAIDESENLASFSQYGSSVELTAPGVDVLSTYPNDSYNAISGTSMACPAATGVAALGLAADTSLTNDELRDLLKSTARDVGLSSDEQGAGCADAGALVEEILGGGGGGGGEPGNATAEISASTTAPEVDEEVTFDGSASSSENGAITSYEWTASNGASGSGETFSTSFAESGDANVTLQVTDEAGETDTSSVALSVDGGGGGGGECGDEVSTSTAEGSLSWWTPSEDYSYPAQTADPCQLTLTLEGPADADFDLYVTYDGRTPTTSDYDDSGVSYDAQEEVVVDDLDSSSEIGILVTSYYGSGSYVLEAEELGK